MNVNMVRLNISPAIDHNDFPISTFIEPVIAFLEGLEGIGVTKAPYIPEGRVVGIINFTEDITTEKTHFKIAVSRKLGDELIDVDVSQITEDEANLLHQQKMETAGAIAISHDLADGNTEIEISEGPTVPKNSTIH